MRDTIRMRQSNSVRSLHLPARILSSSDPSALASDSRRRLTMPSVQRSRQNTCRWSGSCPSRTEARSCTGGSNQGAVTAETHTELPPKRLQQGVQILTLPSRWHQFRWTYPVRNSTELRGRLLHHQPEPSSPFCQL